MQLVLVPLTRDYVFFGIRHHFPTYCCLIKNIVARISYFAAYIYGGGF